MTSMTKLPSSEPARNARTDEIEEHIEQTRHELGQTVEALSHKLDVKAQTQERMSVAREKAGQVASRIKDSSRRSSTLLLAASTAAGVVAAVMAWRNRR